MASRIAKPPCVGLTETDRYLPLTVCHTIPDMLELGAGMGLMARPTGSTELFPVDMQEMQILVAIAEIRQIVGSGRLNQRPFVTAKTQLIFCFIK